MNLSFIIVNYNVTDLLRNCLRSIQKYVVDIDYEIIVIDNDSTDASWKNLIDEFPDVDFITNSKNEGFAIANNKAVRKAQGEYILLLNPDTELEGFYMKEILDFANTQSHFGSLGVRMHDATGLFLPESKRSVPNILSSFNKLFLNSKKTTTKSYYRNDINEFDIAEVEVITGAFFLIKKNVYAEIGGLDESYFMYGEDIDICYTLLLRGLKNYYYGKASILHHKGESTVKDDIYLSRFYGAMKIFIDKYYKKQKPVQYLFLRLGLNLKHGLERARL